MKVLINEKEVRCGQKLRKGGVVYYIYVYLLQKLSPQKLKNNLTIFIFSLLTMTNGFYIDMSFYKDIILLM